MGSLLIIVVLFVLMYVLLIRPQRTRQRDRQLMISSVEVGDEILTGGGIYGIVHEADEDDDLVVEIAEGIMVRVSRDAVHSVLKPETEDAEVDEDGEPVGEAGAEASDDEDPVASGEETVRA